MSLSATPSLSHSRISSAPTPEDRPQAGTAVVAIVADHSARDLHHQVATALPHSSVSTWSAPAAASVVDEIAHRDLVRFALRGAVLGGILLGSMTFAIAISVAAQSPGVGAGLGAAVALTGGSFFGSLMGFFVALLRWEDAHASVRSHNRSGGAAGVLVIEGGHNSGEVRRILSERGATVVDTTTTTAMRPSS